MFKLPSLFPLLSLVTIDGDELVAYKIIVSRTEPTPSLLLCRPFFTPAASATPFTWNLSSKRRREDPKGTLA